jgi:hypothetical protein
MKQKACRTVVGLARPSTPSLLHEDLDARDKPRDKPAYDERRYERSAQSR